MKCEFCDKQMEYSCPNCSPEIDLYKAELKKLCTHKDYYTKHVDNQADKEFVLYICNNCGYVWSK